MKRTILVAVALVMSLVATSLQAQVRFGLKAGVAVNRLSFNRDIINDLGSSENRTGFTGGFMIDVNLPVAGLGMEASAMFVRRTTKIEYYDNTLNRNYITFPVNLKYRLSLPAIGRYLTPFATTGPEFSFLVSNKEDSKWPSLENKSMTCTWNVGFGLILFNRVQLHANYGLGLTKSLKIDNLLNKSGSNANANAKDRYWTVTAAYLF